jgi:hypothetical protein
MCHVLYYCLHKNQLGPSFNSKLCSDAYGVPNAELLLSIYFQVPGKSRYRKSGS